MLIFTLQCKGILAMSQMSVYQTHGLWQNERKFCPDFMPYETTFIPVFRRQEWLVGMTPSAWNFGQSWPHSSKIVNFQSIFACSVSTITASKKSSINTNWKSTMCFPMSLRRTSYVVPKLKQRKMAVFCPKLHLFGRKSLLQTFFVWRPSATEL